MQTLELFDGNKIITYDNSDFISNSIYTFKCWEPNVTDTIINILKKYNNPIVFDVGCNIGYFSIISNLYSSKIYSFDSNVNNINLLNESIQINDIKNISTVHTCVSDNYLTFYRMETENSNNVGALKVIQCEENECNVNTIVLDDYIIKNKITNIHILKIDVEGSELRCINGLKKSIKNKIIKNIIIEITPLWGVDETNTILNILNEDFDLYNIGLIESSEYGEFYKNVMYNRITNLNDIKNDYERNVQTNILGVLK